jgi:predicted transcriptional regulator
MYEQAFEKLGLSRGEIKAYSTLLKHGEMTITPLTSESGITKSKVYEIIEKLIKKGLVGYNVKNNVKHFFINDPRNILEYLNKKENEIERSKKEIEGILPSLIKQRDSATQGRMAEIYEGFNGMKTIREELMLTYKRGETLLVLGAPRIANDKWEGWLLDFHKKRTDKGIGMKIIYNFDAREYGKIRKKMKYTEVRYLPDGINPPNWIDIFPAAVMISIINGDNVVSFVIRSKEIADSFKAYFNIMWSVSTNK